MEALFVEGGYAAGGVEVVLVSDSVDDILALDAAGGAAVEAIFRALEGDEAFLADEAWVVGVGLYAVEVHRRR